MIFHFHILCQEKEGVKEEVCIELKAEATEQRPWSGPRVIESEVQSMVTGVTRMVDFSKGIGGGDCVGRDPFS